MPKPAITTFSSVAVTQSPTNKDNGLYAPELTQLQIDDIPPDTIRNGAIVYNTDAGVASFQIYENGAWESINTSDGDVKGPVGAGDNNIATFDGTTGKIIKDSTVIITRVPPAPLPPLNNFQSNKLAAPLVDVNEIGNLGHIKFSSSGGVGLIFVDSLMPVEFISNSYGPFPEDEQVCSLFTGGLPSSSTSPSALIELQTTTGALLLSRLTQTEINALLPVQGMLVYNTDTQNLSTYNGMGWIPLFAGDLNGNLDLEGYKIVNLGTPTAGTDAATKTYVDTSVSGVATSVTLVGGVTGSGNTGSPITTTVAVVAPSAITGYPGTTSTFLRGDGSWTNILSGNLGLQGATPNAPLQFSSALANRKIVLNQTANNDHQVVGLGTATNTFRFQIPDTVTDYVFFAGTSSTTSNELIRITGTGNLGIGIVPVVKLHIKIPLASSDIGTEFFRFQGSGLRLRFFDQDLTGLPVVGARILFDSGAIGVISSASSLALIPGGGYNVGVNDYAPACKLSVVGNAQIGFASGTTAPSSGLAVSGNVGIGTSTANAPLQFSNALANRKIVLFETANNDHQFTGIGSNSGIFRFQVSATSTDYTFNAGTSSTTSNELMRLTGDGNLGINWNNPLARLDVRVDTDDIGNLIAVFRGSGTRIQFYDQNTGTSTPPIINFSTGLGGRISASGPISIMPTNNLGVNDLSPATRLSVVGNVQIGFASGATAPSSGLAVSGNVGIGTSTANAPLQFSNALANRKIVLFETANNNFQYHGFGVGASTLLYSVGETTSDHVFYAATSSSTRNELARIKGTGGIDVNSNKITSLATPTAGTDATNKTYVDTNISNVANAKYIIQTANASVPNAQILGSLTTGLLKNTTTTGVLTIGVAGTDYYSPGFPTYFKDTSGTAYNFFAGTNAGNSITTGAFNTGVGIESLLNNTSGNNNTALGARSLRSNTTGSFNISIGVLSLFSNTTGAQNVAIGDESLQNNTTGSFNVSIGILSLISNTIGNNNTVLGYNALSSNTSGANNIAIGYNALRSSTTANNNTAIGYEALYSCFGSTDNLGIGYQALRNNTSASSNLAIGNTALYSNTIGIVNLAIGHQALFNNTTSNNNAAICYQALYSNTTGGFNLAFGNYALYSNTTASFNVAIGYQALYFNTTGSTNLAIGYRALFQSSTTSFNVGIGDSALSANTGGNNNVAVGYRALSNNITSSNNTAIGHQALTANTVSGNNTAMGYQALFSNIATNNTAVGYRALTTNTNGTNNTIIGYNAGATYGTYVSCVLIGAAADTTVPSLFNAIAIGAGATVGASNSLVLGNGCNVGIGTSTPSAFGTNNLIVTNTIYGRRASGQIFQNGSGTFTPIGGPTQKIPGVTTSSSLNQFTMPVNNRIQYIGTIPIVIHITLNATVRTTTNTTTFIGIQIVKNLIGINPIMYTTSSIANTPHNISNTTFISMNTNDYIEAYVSSTNTSNMDVVGMVLSVMAV